MMAKKQSKNPRRLNDLTAAPYNPRKITQDAMHGLSTSIDEFGDLSGITFNTRTGHLVTGHQRVKSLGRFGDLEIKDGYIDTPNGERFKVRVVDWDETKEKAANVAANSPRIAGDFTEDLLPLLEEIKIDLPDLAVDLRLEELKIDLDGVSPVQIPSVEEDEAPEPPEDPVAKPGDLWVMGGHRLLCGDCTVQTDVDRLMNREKAILMNTDPPYGIDYVDNAKAMGKATDHRKIANDEADGEKLQAFLEDCIRTAVTVLTQNAAFYLWHPMLTQGTFFAAAAAAADILIHRQIIWVKPSLIMGRGDYHWKHELCFYGWQRGHRPPFYGPRNQDTVWEVNREGGQGHPTQKPVELFVRPLMNHTREGDVCYEPFAGSGSQFIAAEQLDRICYGLEIDPRYCDVIVQRWQALTDQDAILDGDGRSFNEIANLRT
jgi:DNA modification methylase